MNSLDIFKQKDLISPMTDMRSRRKSELNLSVVVREPTSAVATEGH